MKMSFCGSCHSESWAHWLLPGPFLPLPRGFVALRGSDTHRRPKTPPASYPVTSVPSGLGACREACHPLKPVGVHSARLGAGHPPPQPAWGALSPDATHRPFTRPSVY